MWRCNNTISRGFYLPMVLALVWLFLNGCSSKDKNFHSLDRDSRLLPVNSEIVSVSDRSTILNRPVPFHIRYKAETAVAIAAFLLTGLIMAFLIWSILRCRRVVKDYDAQNHMAEQYLNIAGVILTNLIGNAIKFTSQGEISLRISIDASDHQGAGRPGHQRVLKFSVRDTGIGIPKDKFNKVFGKFTQVDTSTTREYGGSGLGLSITKALVEIMGGKIWVESDGEKGSDFIFLLRLEQAEPLVEPNSEHVNPGPLKGLRVAIADDNRNVSDRLKDFCHSAHMSIPFVARSGSEALSLLAAESMPPELLICDLSMPGMEGNGFVEKIRADSTLNSVKLIAADSGAMHGQSEKVRAQGYDGYLPKPYIRSELFSVLKAVVGNGNEKNDRLTPRHPDSAQSFKGIEVLVVEDNPINMMLITHILAKFNMSIDKAGNGHEAIEKIRTKDYNIVLMDIQMPKMNGIEATKIIRRDIDKRLPIIALTASAMPEDRKQAKESGMTDFLVKPIDFGQLETIILTYCV